MQTHVKRARGDRRATGTQLLKGRRGLRGGSQQIIARRDRGRGRERGAEEKAERERDEGERGRSMWKERVWR